MKDSQFADAAINNCWRLCQG